MGKNYPVRRMLLALLRGNMNYLSSDSEYPTAMLLAIIRSEEYFRFPIRKVIDMIYDVESESCSFHELKDFVNNCDIKIIEKLLEGYIMESVFFFEYDDLTFLRILSLFSRRLLEDFKRKTLDRILCSFSKISKEFLEPLTRLGTEKVRSKISELLQLNINSCENKLNRNSQFLGNAVNVDVDAFRFEVTYSPNNLLYSLCHIFDERTMLHLLSIILFGHVNYKLNQNVSLFTSIDKKCYLSLPKQRKVKMFNVFFESLDQGDLGKKSTEHLKDFLDYTLDDFELIETDFLPKILEGVDGHKKVKMLTYLSIIATKGYSNFSSGNQARIRTALQILSPTLNLNYFLEFCKVIDTQHLEETFMDILIENSETIYENHDHYDRILEFIQKISVNENEGLKEKLRILFRKTLESKIGIQILNVPQNTDSEPLSLNLFMNPNSNNISINLDVNEVIGQIKNQIPSKALTTIIELIRFEQKCRPEFLELYKTKILLVSEVSYVTRINAVNKLREILEFLEPSQIELEIFPPLMETLWRSRTRRHKPNFKCFFVSIFKTLVAMLGRLEKDTKLNNDRNKEICANLMSSKMLEVAVAAEKLLRGKIFIN